MLTVDEELGAICELQQQKSLCVNTHTLSKLQFIINNSYYETSRQAKDVMQTTLHLNIANMHIVYVWQ